VAFWRWGTARVSWQRNARRTDVRDSSRAAEQKWGVPLRSRSLPICWVNAGQRCRHPAWSWSKWRGSSSRATEPGKPVTYHVPMASPEILPVLAAGAKAGENRLPDAQKTQRRAVSAPETEF
jgi:hypothetical protein